MKRKELGVRPRVRSRWGRVHLEELVLVGLSERDVRVGVRNAGPREVRREVEDLAVRSSEVVIPCDSKSERQWEREEKDKWGGGAGDSLLPPPAIARIKSIGLQDLDEHLAQSSTGQVDLEPREGHDNVEDGVLVEVGLSEGNGLDGSRRLPLAATGLLLLGLGSGIDGGRGGGGSSRDVGRRGSGGVGGRGGRGVGLRVDRGQS